MSTTNPMKNIRDNKRQYKTTEALLQFYYGGKEGKADVFITPEGNFLTPKAVKNFLNKELDKLEGEIRQTIYVTKCKKRKGDRYSSKCSCASCALMTPYKSWLKNFEKKIGRKYSPLT